LRARRLRRRALAHTGFTGFFRIDEGIMQKLLIGIAMACAATWSGAAATLAWVNEPGGVAVALDAADNVYTARWDYNPAGDIYVAKRDVSGVLQWEVRYDNTDTTRHEVATWVDTDSAGNVLVSGTIRSGFSSPVNAASVLMKFAPDGRLLWRRVYDGSFDGSSTRKLLVDAADNVYVLGLGMGPSGLVSTVKKFDAGGNAVWAWFDVNGIGAPLNFKWTPDGALLVAARGITGSINGYARIDRAGKRLWAVAGVPSLTTGDAAGDAAGNSYLINGNVAGGSGSLLRKVGPGGVTIWERSHPSAGLRVEVGPDGAPLVSGYPNAGTAGAAFFKFGADGSLQWSTLDADGPSVALLAHAQMKLDAAGNAYLAGSTMTQMGVTMIRSDGAPAWTALTPGGYAAALALGHEARVFVTGGLLTVRIDAPASPAPEADLAVALADAPDPVTVRKPFVVTATVANRGTAAATAAQLGLTLPANTTLVKVVASQGSCSGTATLACALGTLASGAQATVAVTLRPKAAGTLTTTAGVSATEFDPDRSNNSASATTAVQRR
jgi:hypothetical protein